MERSPFIAPEGIGLVGPVHVPQGASVPVEVVLGLLMVLFHKFEGFHWTRILPPCTPQDKASASTYETVEVKLHWIVVLQYANIGSP